MDGRARLFPPTFLVLLLAAGPLRADPQPGDVFRDYRWQPKLTFERMTSPEAKAEGAKKHLPNPINTVELADLDRATRLEVQIELLQSHAGTIGQAIRFNGGPWIEVPVSARIPGEAGTEKSLPQRWLSMRYPAFDVPLAGVKAGTNTFELTCRPGVDLGAGWPQSIYYGVIFRVYYGADKSAPAGRVVVPTVLRERGVFPLAADVTAAAGHAIRRVDFIPRYLGYGWRGEGVGLEYQFHTRYGELQRHAGFVAAPPWRVEWDARWVPEQPEPVQVIARIEDETGLATLTPAATIETFRGMPNVRIFAAQAIPPRWQTRAGRRQSCIVRLPDDLSRLREARVILATWNGLGADAIGVNDTMIAGNIGRNHGLSYDELSVPVSALKPGDNVFFTASASPDHGIEVLWPAFTLLARFAPEPVPAAARPTE